MTAVPPQNSGGQGKGVAEVWSDAEETGRPSENHD